MTVRDRLMLMGIVALAILGGVWFTTVAPERQRAAKVDAEVQSARSQVESAESQADSAVSARDQYSAAYTSLVSLGQAVPSTPETPSLIYTLDRVTHHRDVQFNSIASGSGGSASSSSSATTATAAFSTFTQMPFTFVFEGSFVDLYKLLDQLEGFTAQTPNGKLHVNGPLLTINDVNLAPTANAAQLGAKAKATQLTVTVSATAYVLPAGASTLAGASPSGPATSTATEAASTSGSSGAPAPAVVKAP